MPPSPFGRSLSRAEAHYPELPGADVLILSATGRQWKLEASILRNCSPYFTRILKEDKYHVSKKQRDLGQTIGWRIQLRKSRLHHPEDPRFREFYTLVSPRFHSLIIPNTIQSVLSEDALAFEVHTLNYKLVTDSG
jgi:hypothetical protein